MIRLDYYAPVAAPNNPDRAVSATVWNAVVGKLSESPSVTDYGADTDASDNATALALAEAAGEAVYVPEGRYASSLATSALPGRLFGIGQVGDTGGYRAPSFTQLEQAPSSYGNSDSIVTAFNGDLDAVNLAFEHRVTGSATLTQPTSGYVQKPETAGVFGFGYNSSGYNHSTSGNGGRTGASLLHLNVANGGQGDYEAVFLNGVVSGAKEGATHFLANPAIGGVAGQFFAGSDGVYLNVIELNMSDLGHRAAAIGAVFNFHRTVDDDTLGEVWMGFRPQSKGTEAADVIYSGAGDWKRGLDLVHADFGTDKAAVALSVGQRIYGNAVSSGVIGWSQALGAEWLEYAADGWQFCIESAPALLVKSVENAVNYLSIQARETGIGVLVDANGSDTDVSIAYRSKAAGGHVFYTNKAAAVAQFAVEHQASAVNYIAVHGGETGSFPAFFARGADTDIDIRLTPKGNGGLRMPVANVRDFADDAAASAGGVPVGGFYRTSSAMKVRVS